MRRSFVLVLAILVAAIAFFGRASAVTKVGGFAFGYHVESILASPRLGTNILTVDTGGPVVELPSTGSAMPITKELAGQTVGRVSFTAGRVSIHGTLAGTPYAQASALLAGVTVSTLSLRTIQSECIWDVTGAKASTTIVDAAGNSFMPPPDTKVAFPGGYIIFNEQIKATFEGAEVITVRAARVHIDPVKIGLFVYAGGPDVSLAVSVCDPLPRPPSLTGIKLLGGGT